MYNTFCTKNLFQSRESVASLSRMQQWHSCLKMSFNRYHSGKDSENRVLHPPHSSIYEHPEVEWTSEAVQLVRRHTTIIVNLFRWAHLIGHWKDLMEKHSVFVTVNCYFLFGE